MSDGVRSSVPACKVHLAMRKEKNQISKGP